MMQYKIWVYLTTSGGHHYTQFSTSTREKSSTVDNHKQVCNKL